MFTGKQKEALTQEIQDFVFKDFTPHYGELRESLRTDPRWRRFEDLGTELWLDTGSISDIGPLWTRDFAALTTNNTLLNKEVQGGQYDDLIRHAGELLRKYDLDDHHRKLELAFILNARHALRLVEKFDAHVSVEEHTDLADDVEAAVEVGRRYFQICPQRFIIKLPFTPAGVIATRLLSDLGIPVNHTLGFSARQNYVIARLAKPRFVNVFLGRLNQFVIDNKLGDGTLVGEKATVASQQAIRELRTEYGLATRQIAASFRSGQQVLDLAGVDVMTIPPKVASEFATMNLPTDEIIDRSKHDYRPPLNDGVDALALRMDTLWEIGDRITAATDELSKMRMDRMLPGELVSFFADRGCEDFFVRWTSQQIQTSRKEGKIPCLDNWRGLLANKTIGLDSLLNLAGLMSFATDQKAMDDRVEKVLHEQMAHAWK